ncbi:MAG: hypothetical protein ABIH09_02550, partial [Candidatus Omnitrophota bacterium]
MQRKHFFTSKTAIILTAIVFLFNNISYGLDVSKNTLAAPNFAFEGNKQEAPTPQFKDDITASRFEAKKMEVFLFLAKQVLEKPDFSEEDLTQKLNQEFPEGFESVLKGLKINIEGIKVANGDVQIPYETPLPNIAQMRMRIREFNPQKDEPSWQKIDKYEFKFEPAEVPETNERDLKGFEAPPTKPIIRDLIGERQLTEIYLDEVTGKLKANKVRWVDNYVPILTPVELFRGEEINLHEIYTKPEQRILIDWMKSHRVMGEPVKFRITLGNSALGVGEDIEHSNIAYASIFTGTINMGSVLLKHLLKKENKALRKEILDNHEFKRLQGIKFISKEDYQRRLKFVEPVVNSIKEWDRAMSERDVYFLLDELRGLLKKGNEISILEMFSVLNHIALKWRKWPIEARWPIKHAVSLLDRKEQDKLIKILQGKKSIRQGYRDLILIDDTLLMFEDEVETEKEWYKKHASELADTSFWVVSPEIWHEAGGLARVLQNDSVAALGLMKGSNMRFRTLEAWYSHRVDANGQVQELNYTNPEHITHPIQGKIEIEDKFDVKVGSRTVKAIVGTGINDLGVETFMIKDEGGYFTHSLYNYSKYEEHDPNRGTWEDFSVFYSKAAKKFIKRYTAREKKKLKKENKKWGGLVIYTQDSQTALIPVHWKIELDAELEKKRQNPDHKIDPILLEAINIFKTHTYANRQEYTLDGSLGDDVMDYMEIPKEYRELFKHLGKDGKYVYDMASGGLRSADDGGQIMVSRAQFLDLNKYDEWANVPRDERLKILFKKFGVNVDTIAMANADNRALTAKEFRRIMRDLYDKNIDVEHPTADQVKQTKIQAKKEFSMKHMTYYSSHNKPDNGIVLNPDQIVISYSGRLVPKKLSKERSFFENNLEQLVSSGAQVVVYGNVQNGNKDSYALADWLIPLTDKFRKRNYSGKLIFAPRFTLNDERWLKAASDVGVHDSQLESEAAGFTESDDAVCGGIVVVPLRTGKHYNDGVGEGLYTVQGLEMDFERPGRGNTVTPKSMTAQGYMEVFRKLLDKYEKDELKHYQATSIRLSRVLGARSKFAEELRYISKLIARKK